MTIWKSTPSLEQLNSLNHGTIHSTLGLQFVGIGEDYLEATLPVDERTRQPMGLLHGGASAVLAESLGSVASLLVTNELDHPKVICVGIELNLSHLKSVRDGTIRGRATPVRLGKTLHVWEIVIRDEKQGQEVCRSRLTVLVRENA